MSAAPILACGVSAEDRAAIRTEIEPYGRTMPSGADVCTPETPFNHSAPAIVFLAATPGEDGGLAACARWKAVHPEVPVVILAPDDAIETKLDAVTAGADQFLVSPVDEEALQFVLHFFLVEKGR